jgi:SAM-dependent methyltransferase
MRLKPRDLEKITDLTLKHYNEYAEYFWEGTRDHNVSQNIAALLQSIQGKPPYTILDFGCGPGRDLKVFAELGQVAIGFGRRRTFRRDGARPWRLRSMATRFPEAWSAG